MKRKQGFEMEITKIDTAKEIKDFSCEQMNIFERKKRNLL